MTWILVTDADGYVLRWYQAGKACLPNAGETHTTVNEEPAWAPSGKRLRFVDGVFQHVDSRTLVQARADRIAVLKTARNAAIVGGFEWSGDRFDSDDVSQNRITQAAMRAADPGYEPRPFRTQDNGWRTLSASDAQLLLEAMDAHIQQQFAKFKACEEEVLAAASNAAVDAVVW